MLIKHSVSRAVLVLTVVLAFLGMQSPAKASSVYDNGYTTIDTLSYGDVNYYGINCTVKDVTDTFLSIFGDSNNWVYSGEYQNFWPDFMSAYSSGSWAATVHQERMSSGYDLSVNLIWDSSGGSIDFATSGSTAYGNSTKYAQLYMRQALLGNGGCVPAIRGIQGNAPLSTSTAIDPGNTGNGNYYSNYVAVEWSYVYPSGYAGSTVRSTASSTPSLHNGTVDCGTDDLSYMLITQDGDTHSVPLVHESSYRANWEYFLSSGMYGVTVGCGTSVASSVGTVSPATSSGDWVCTTNHNPPYCVLS